MTAVLTALLPVFLVILLGAALGRAGGFEPDFWTALERLVYWVLFPSLLFGRLATASIPADDALALAMTLGGGTLMLGILLLAAVRFWGPMVLRTAGGPYGPASSSVVQGSVRMNSYIGLASAELLFGAPSAVLMVAALAVMVPLMNLLGVAALLLLGNADRRRGSGIVALVRAALGNPPIVACLAGLAVNLVGIGLTNILAELLSILGRASLPLGLLAVGAGLVPAAVGRAVAAVSVAAGLKLIVLPFIVWTIGRAVGIDGATLGVAVLFAGLPVSVSAYVMARRMGGDGDLMGAILTVQTVLSAITLPAIVLLAG